MIENYFGLKVAGTLSIWILMSQILSPKTFHRDGLVVWNLLWSMLTCVPALSATFSEIYEAQSAHDPRNDVAIFRTRFLDV